MNNEENKDLAQHKDEVAKVAPNTSNEDVSQENTVENTSEVSVNTDNTTENVNVSVEILAEKQAEEEIGRAHV